LGKSIGADRFGNSTSGANPPKVSMVTPELTNQQENRQMTLLEMRALMTTPPDTIMPHPFTGKPATVGEVLKAIMNGEGAAVVPVQHQPGQPGYSPGPNLTISQDAINALSQTQYDELKATGQLQGLTTTDAGRAYVHVRQGGSHSTSFTLDEKGEVGPGRGLDLRDFDAPAGS
jgi:hypothetical protein